MGTAHRLKLILIVMGTVGSGSVMAQVPALFQGADLAHGEQLIMTNRCSGCHQNRVGGNGSDIYNPQGRINSAGKLRGMVEACNLQLNLTLFPDEVNSIAAVLNRDFYRFKN